MNESANIAVNESNENNLSTLANLINIDIPSFADLSEDELQCKLKIKMINLGASLLKEQWTIDGRSDWGCGDLVFELPDITVLVVEVKAIQFGLGSGKHQCTRRTKRRQDVSKQARFYRDLYCEHISHDSAVRCATFTDENGLVIIYE